MNRPGVSIIISTYGRGEYLKDLIASIRASTPADAFEIIIVSSDLPESEKIQWIKEQKDITLIHADSRKKWQRRQRSAHYYINLGIKKSSKEWVIVASDDTRFDKDWYTEFTNLINDPHNANVGMIIVATHLGKVKYGLRILKIGRTKKGNGEWKDLYLSDVCITRKDTLEAFGWYDENLDWAGAGSDNSLAMEFLTGQDTITSDKIKIYHSVAAENRGVTLADDFSDFHYILNKWNKWCQKNNCQFFLESDLKPFTPTNRLKNFFLFRARILRHYLRHFTKALQHFISA